MSSFLRSAAPKLCTIGAQNENPAAAAAVWKNLLRVIAGMFLFLSFRLGR